MFNIKLQLVKTMIMQMILMQKLLLWSWQEDWPWPDHACSWLIQKSPWGNFECFFGDPPPPQTSPSMCLLTVVKQRNIHTHTSFALSLVLPISYALFCLGRLGKFRQIDTDGEPKNVTALTKHCHRQNATRNRSSYRFLSQFKFLSLKWFFSLITETCFHKRRQLQNNKKMLPHWAT